MGSIKNQDSPVVLPKTDNILEKIYKAGLKFLAPLTIEETYKTIANEAVKLVGADFSSIVLAEDGELKKVYASSSIGYQIKPRRYGNTLKVFRTGKATISYVKEWGKAHPHVKERGIKSSIFIPLSYQNKSIGVLIVNTFKNEKFTQKELNILSLFGSQASLAIRKTQLYEESRKALEMRDLFISMASHELRTPLTAINGYIQLLMSKMRGKDTQEAKWIEHLSWESVRLTGLIKELLEVNRIKSGEFEYHWKECSTRIIIDRLVKNFELTHPYYKLIIKDNIIGKNDKVIGDFDKLIQVFTNLVDNAAKFSPIGKPIEVILKANSSQINVSVKDSGEGIKEEEIPKIFESFYKGKSHLKEGMGLGLFLANYIVRAHHGTIKVNSKFKKGTTMEVCLPKAKI